MKEQHAYLLDMDAIPKGPTRQEILNAWKQEHNVETHCSSSGVELPWCALYRKHPYIVEEHSQTTMCEIICGEASHLEYIGILQCADTEREACDLIAKSCKLPLCDFGLLGAPQ